jgi:hypothetical protein
MEQVKKSRGRSDPKTLAGKQRSRINFRKHGLASLLLVGDRSSRVEELRNYLGIGLRESDVRFLVYEVAIARVQLEDVMAARAAIFGSCFRGGADQTSEVETAREILNVLGDLKQLQRY